MIGTNREPPKNESAFGSTILWKRLCSAATPRPTMIPPNTPICRVGIPSTFVMVPSRTNSATLPSANTLPVFCKTALMEIFITRNAIIADRAATSFSAFAMPMATPTAKMIGRLSKMTLPALLMMVSSAWSMVPSPKKPSNP